MGLVNILPLCLASRENIIACTMLTAGIALPAATPPPVAGKKDLIAPFNPEICALLAMNVLISGTPPLNDASNTAYGNLEQKYSEFYASTVFPMTTIIEEQFRQSLLTFEEKQNLVIKFKYNALLRVDTKTRIEYYKKMFDIGAFSQNKILSYEDENKIEFGDKTYVQLNLATLENAQKTTPKLQKEILTKGDQ